MLQIANPRERAAVAAADAALRLAALARGGRARPPRDSLRRVLVLRLERIGDLVMSLPALHELRALATGARIDLVTGAWNEALARQVAGIDAVEVMSAPWLARGDRVSTWPELWRQAGAWRSRQYDLAINLEGDIRTNLILARARARWSAGFGMAGGGPLLDQDVRFDPLSHTAVNGVRLVRAALGEAAAGPPWPAEGREAAARLPRAGVSIPAPARAEADAMLAPAAGRLLVGLHVGAGRLVKDWPASRMAAAGAWAARARHAAIVLTGAAPDRGRADEIRRALPDGAMVIDTVGSAPLMTLAAILARLSLFISPDTGPMHLAAALGTPLVALFGPSSPERWGPLSADARVLRVDLPCSPCNRIRNPPARCQGRTPECMDGIDTGRVIEAAAELLDRVRTEAADGRR